MHGHLQIIVNILQKQRKFDLFRYDDLSSVNIVQRLTFEEPFHYPEHFVSRRLALTQRASQPAVDTTSEIQSIHTGGYVSHRTLRRFLNLPFARAPRRRLCVHVAERSFETRRNSRVPPRRRDLSCRCTGWRRYRIRVIELLTGTKRARE